MQTTVASSTIAQLSDFHLDTSGKVIGCPEAHAPVHFKKEKTRYCAAFDIAYCNGCPNQPICPVKPGKKAGYLRFSDKQRRISLRRCETDTDGFKDRCRWRAGVEATTSELDRPTGVKQLRVLGFKAVRFSATLKALGLNILRAAAVLAAILAPIPEKTGPQGGGCALMHVFKERIRVVLVYFSPWLAPRPSFVSKYPKQRFR